MLLLSPPPPHTYTVEYHRALLENDPSVVELIVKMINSEEINFVHIALWIIAQFISVAGEK